MGSDLRTRGGRREAGFTLVEMIIVCGIVALLLGGVVLALRSARSDAGEKETVVVGTTYATAISAYQADHGGMAPQLGTAVEWPVPGDGPLMKTYRPGTTTQARYIRGGTPSAVSSGRVALAATPPSGGGAVGWLQYVRAPDGRAFSLLLFYRTSKDKPWPATATCRLGTTAGATPPPCA